MMAFKVRSEARSFLGDRSGADSLSFAYGFEFHRGLWVAKLHALLQILSQERLYAAELLVLGCVNALVDEELPITAAIEANEDSVLQGHTSCVRCH